MIIYILKYKYFAFVSLQYWCDKSLTREARSLLIIRRRRLTDRSPDQRIRSEGQKPS